MWTAILFLTIAADPSPPPVAKPAKAYLLSMARLPAPQRYDPAEGMITYAAGYPKKIEPGTWPSLRADGPLRVAGACLPDDAHRLAPFIKPASQRFELIPIDEWPESELPCPKILAGWQTKMVLDTSDGKHTIEGTWFERSREAKMEGLVADWKLVLLRRTTEGKPVSVQSFAGQDGEKLLSFTADDSGLHVEVVRFQSQCYLGEKGTLVKRRASYPIPPDGPKQIIHEEQKTGEVDCPKTAMKRPTEEELAKKKKLDDQTMQMLKILEKNKKATGD